MTRNGKRILIVDVMMLFIFVAVAFIVPFNRNIVFWTSLGFAVFAILVQMLMMKIAFCDGRIRRSKIYGFPIARISVIYMMLQVVLSLVADIVDMFVEVAFWIPLMIYVIILAVSVIIFITADVVRDVAIGSKDMDVVKTEYMHEMTESVHALIGQTSDEAAKKSLAALYEELKFSDPVSCSALTEIESELYQQITELKKTVADEDNSVVGDMCKAVLITLTERNRLCKLNKVR